MILENRPLQIIKNGNYFDIVISELILERFHKDYDLGWGLTYAKRKIEYFNKNSIELLKLINFVRKTGKVKLYEV